MFADNCPLQRWLIVVGRKNSLEYVHDLKRWTIKYTLKKIIVWHGDISKSKKRSIIINARIWKNIKRSSTKKRKIIRT